MLHILTLIQAYLNSPIPWLLKISATPFIPLFIKTLFYFGTKSIDWDEGRSISLFKTIQKWYKELNPCIMN